jgi:hypothetical protein
VTGTWRWCRRCLGTPERSASVARLGPGGWTRPVVSGVVGRATGHAAVRASCGRPRGRTPGMATVLSTPIMAEGSRSRPVCHELRLGHLVRAGGVLRERGPWSVRMVNQILFQCGTRKPAEPGVVVGVVDLAQLAEDVTSHAEAATLPVGHGQDGLDGVPGPAWASLITRCTPPITAVSASINARCIVWPRFGRDPRRPRSPSTDEAQRPEPLHRTGRHLARPPGRREWEMPSERSPVWTTGFSDLAPPESVGGGI